MSSDVHEEGSPWCSTPEPPAPASDEDPELRAHPFRTGFVGLEMAGEPLLPTYCLEPSSLATLEAAFGPRQKVGSRCMRRDVEPGTPGRRRECVNAWQRK